MKDHLHQHQTCNHGLPCKGMDFGSISDRSSGNNSRWIVIQNTHVRSASVQYGHIDICIVATGGWVAIVYATANFGQ